MNDTQTPNDLIAAYKELLRDFLAKRPSGLRKKISDAIGTNRSFVSQITNPKYSVPIPSHYVQKIIAVCHLTPSERAQFLEAYVEAHPGQAELLTNGALSDADAITIDLSAVKDEAQRDLIRQTLKYTAESLIGLATGRRKDRP
ncbi:MULTISPECIES: hypothetical protein [unclassified Ensifer]|uniref:hypothetical protein n=1 Tax=unclassified Ensifer TaxID=2633371 RepID=UPI0008137513|nr:MULTISPECIES: hypothetical protein [unclassified Ensifer]OCP23579.1 hypothetical protein BC363_24415 [Ensifer sp. LC384]OCP24266.1 hypothetical protein BC361_20895 [Ensifer sp. LC54]